MGKIAKIIGSNGPILELPAFPGPQLGWATEACWWWIEALHHSDLSVDGKPIIVEKHQLKYLREFGSEEAWQVSRFFENENSAGNAVVAVQKVYYLQRSPTNV